MLSRGNEQAKGEFLIEDEPEVEETESGNRTYHRSNRA